MKRFLIFTTIAISLFSIAYISVARNNGGSGWAPINMGRYTGSVAWGHDAGIDLYSNAYTGVFRRAADPDSEIEAERKVVYNWSASANVGYNGNDESTKGDYSVHAKILTYSQDRSGKWDGGDLDINGGFYVQMSPPPDGVVLDRNDCSSYGGANRRRGLLGKVVDYTVAFVNYP